MLRPGKSLPVRKQLDEPHNGEAMLEVDAARLTISLNQDWHFRRMESAGGAGSCSAGSYRGAKTGKRRIFRIRCGWSRSTPAAGEISRASAGIPEAWSLPGQWKEKIVYLHFEGAMQVAEVWLNKTKLASNYCGYLPFVVDLTRAANFGAGGNILSVRLDNRDNPQVPPGKPQKELDFTYFGGLYRNVRLEVMDRLHIVDPILGDKIAGGGVFVTFPT